ncbi:MAG: histidine kinase [Prevotella sp.]|nr:histidine kinase [Prevotella sp.]
MTHLKRELKENLVYLALWIILFAAPVVSQLVHVQDHSHMEFRWDDIFSVWHIYVGFLVVFLIHNFLLAPILIYRQRKLAYFSSVFLLLVAFMLYQCRTMPGQEPGGPEFAEGPGQMPPPPFDEANDSLFAGPPAPGEAGPDSLFGHFPGEREEMADQHQGPEFRPDDGPHPGEKKPLKGMPIIENVMPTVIVLLLMGMNLGVKLYFKADDDMKEMQMLEKKSLEHQLAYLKYQINPHFLMNTLNNIHALVDIEPEKAKETIVILSRIMRHVLYDGDRSLIPLQHELDFLNNYVDLMRIRYTDHVRMNVDVPTALPEASIPPLLLITFVENAFKHGISYKQESFVDIKVVISDKRLKFTCRNSKVRRTETESSTKKPEEGGVGLANVKQRLQLLYGKNYTLDIDDGTDTFEVLLLIPLLTIKKKEND